MSVLKRIFRPEFVECNLGSIDMDKGVLFGVKIIELGDINDSRPYFVDEETLQQVVDLGNNAPKGVKVRYTHVEHEDAMGSHLGRASNFRIEDNSVRADITFAKSAFASPKGNLAGYVMTLAEEDSESLGMSVAGMLDANRMSDESVEGMMPLRFYELYSADVVAEPAATRNGIFSIQEDNMKDELGVKVEVSVDEDKKPQSEMEEQSPPEGKPEAIQAEEAKDEEMQEGYPEKPEGEMAEEPVAEGEGEAEPVEAEEEKVEDKLEDEEDPKSEKKPIAASAKLFVEHFGKDGAMWYLEGRDLNECFAKKVADQKAIIRELQEKVAKFEALVDAGAFALGEDAPVAQSVELSSEEKANQDKEAKRLELAKKGISGSDARWASTWNF